MGHDDFNHLRSQVEVRDQLEAILAILDAQGEALAATFVSRAIDALKDD